ncbi:MAG: hypothetical protein AB2L13_12880 [Spirochaetota bacterium]
MTGLIIAVAVLALFLTFKGVRIVPQAQNWLVERFGKYAATLLTGAQPHQSRFLARVREDRHPRTGA